MDNPEERDEEDVAVLLVEAGPNSSEIVHTKIRRQQPKSRPEIRWRIWKIATYYYKKKKKKIPIPMVFLQNWYQQNAVINVFLTFIRLIFSLSLYHFLVCIIHEPFGHTIMYLAASW